MEANQIKFSHEADSFHESIDLTLEQCDGVIDKLNKLRKNEERRTSVSLMIEAILTEIQPANEQVYALCIFAVNSLRK